MKKLNICIILVLSLLCGAFFPNTTSLAATNKTAPGDGGDHGGECTLSESSKHMLSGDSFSLDIFGVMDEDTTTYTSSNENIVTIEKTSVNSATCTAKNTGNATITVTIEQGGFLFFKKKRATLTCSITVTPRAVSVKFLGKRLKVKAGKTKQLSVNIKPYVSEEIPDYYSENSSVATIDSNGNVSGVNKGKTFVYAVLSNGKTARCRVIVKE